MSAVISQKQSPKGMLSAISGQQTVVEHDGEFHASLLALTLLHVDEWMQQGEELEGEVVEIVQRYVEPLYSYDDFRTEAEICQNLEA